MNTIPIHLPGATVRGELLAHYAPEDWDEDLLQVELPNGVIVDVGGSADGEFVVTVYRGFPRNRLAPQQFLRTPGEVAGAVTALAHQFAAEPVGIEAPSRV